MTAPIWTPSEARIRDADLTRFNAWLAERSGAVLANGGDLHRWSIANREDFWAALWDYFGVIGDKGPQPWLLGDGLLGERFFPGATLNFAENLLGLAPGDDDAPALVFRGEDKAAFSWTWGDLKAQVSRLQQALKAAGIGPGDRVAGLLPNRPESVAAMLATVSLGAAWAST